MGRFYTIVGTAPLTIAHGDEVHAEEVTTEETTTTTESVSGETHSDTAATEEHTETTTHTTESTGHATEEEEAQGIAALGLDPIAIAAQLITFLLLFWVVKKFALDGIVKNLQKRNEDINRGLHLTAEMDKQKAELEERVDAVLKTARQDADGILAEARKESGQIIKAAEESAGRKADEILRAAEGKIERDIADARRGLRTEMAGLVSEATEAILGEKLNDGGDRKLVENYLKEAMK